MTITTLSYSFKAPERTQIYTNTLNLMCSYGSEPGTTAQKKKKKFLRENNRRKIIARDLKFVLFW